ncbi:hypothetical protein NQ317_005156 [Molorchus minor]|uniref:ZAD domain-containing protein n=1 Tax=Molorchus minor TaxID=1323400 RepID=A0ABQ9K1M8_9CUCU|nr:hypothetical protein NQ317_005156 [Molorchus minor]
MKNLLDPNEEVLQIITNLASVSNLEIEINESLPCYICNSCEEKLRNSYDFQQMVLKSHRFILACFSATDTLKASDILGIQNGSDSFANLIDSNSIETNAEVTYKNYIADTCAENVNNYDILIEGQNSEQAGNDKYWNTKEAENIYQEPVKLQQVDKKTKNNQTMRLAQYSSEQVDGIIKKIRGRIFRNVDCIYCGFRATHSRSLSVHMTRLHKQLKKNGVYIATKLSIT